ncbi:hypothetical protein F4802DRAFT_579548 [Xylaria palmicola]|nr:hypothetical protein F4802DRAFT_579548 [Xylaria palmicola]
MASSHLAHDIPSSSEIRIVDASKLDATAIDKVDLENMGGNEVEAGSDIESGDTAEDTAEGAKISHSRTMEEYAEWPEEGQPQDRPDHSTVDTGGFPDIESDVSLSNRVHVVGFNVHARFVAHTVGSIPGASLGVFAHHRIVRTRWGEEHRRLDLYDDRGVYASSTPVPCPEPILTQNPYDGPSDAYFLDNVIIDTTTAAVIPSLEALSARIDSRTTVCLLHPGLGLLERIYEHIYQDPEQRPNFVLGHSTHKIGRVSDMMYSVQQKKPGTLYLFGLPKVDEPSVIYENPGPTLDKSSSAYQGMQQTQHLIRLLSSAEYLNVVPLPWVRFLSWKLPWIIFTSLADTISVILGCKYNQIRHNAHARAMWDSLLEETLAIVAQLPELQKTPHRIDYFTRPSFRRKLQLYLIAQKHNTSPWIQQVWMGAEPPVDYSNGYIIHRAQELGLDHKHNLLAAQTVKARVNARRKELQSYLQGKPYISDSDLVRRQPAPSLEEVLDIEFNLDQ